MVDVSNKGDTKRKAVAAATVRLGPAAFATLVSGRAAKGNVLVTARLAGIMAAKRTSDLICCSICEFSRLAHHLRENLRALLDCRRAKFRGG